MSNDATMTISRRGNGYTAIPNHVPRDESISLDARGFLCLIMTMSDGWKFRRSNLMKTCGIAKDKYHRITRELKDAGYLTIENIRGEKGRITGTSWIIHDSPDQTATGVRKTRTPVETATGVRKTRTPVITDVGGIRPVKKEQLSKEKQEEDSVSDFDLFWKASPRKVDPKGTREAFDQALKTVDGETLINSMQAYRETCDREGTVGRWVLHPAKWLDKERWLDEPDQPGAKSPAAKSGDRAPMLKYYIDLLNSDEFLPRGMISSSLADELYQSGQVTAQRLRERLPT